MQNKGLYSLAALAVLLGGLYVAIPANAADSSESAATLADTKADSRIVNKQTISALDAQNYKFLNDRIVTLTKQLNALKASSGKQEDKQIYADLYAKLEKLNRDNESLKQLNESLQEKLSNKQLLVNQDTKGNYEQLLSKLNDELAFYKSDNDNLKLSISEKDNTINNLNSLLNTLYNQRQMDDFEHDNSARRLQKELEDAKIKIAAGLKNNTDLSKENEILKQRVSNLSKLEVINQSISKEQANLNLQILKLQQELKAAERSNDELRKSSKANSSKLALDNKNLLAQLDDANARILKLAGQNNDYKNQLQNQTALKAQTEQYKNELLKQKLDYEKEKAASVQELSKLSAHNQEALDGLNKELAKQNKLNGELSEKLRKISDEKSALELKSKELNADLKNTKTKLESNIKQVQTLQASNDKLGVLNKDFKDQLETIKKDKIELSAKFNALSKEFLSYKNSNYDRNFKDYNAIKDKLMKLSISYDELNAKNLALKDELANTQLDYKNLQESHQSLQNELNQAKANNQKASEDEKIAKLEAANEKLLKELDEANLKQLDKFNAQNKELLALKEQNESLSKQLLSASTKNSLANIKEVASIDCDDIRVGSTELSESCKLRLKDFLAKFDSSYYYEITPIINNGGFRSLSRLSASQMPADEVARLTKLANYGLSKDRVVAARKYIEQQVPKALISLSPQTSMSTSKKGFILKVYK